MTIERHRCAAGFPNSSTTMWLSLLKIIRNGFQIVRGTIIGLRFSVWSSLKILMTDVTNDCNITVP